MKRVFAVSAVLGVVFLAGPVFGQSWDSDAYQEQVRQQENELRRMQQQIEEMERRQRAAEREARWQRMLEQSEQNERDRAAYGRFREQGSRTISK